MGPGRTHHAALGLALALLSFGGAAHAYSTGINNRAQVGCGGGGCHAGGDAPAVTLDGPATLAPGANGTFTIHVAGGQQRGVGVDVSASGGRLAPVDADLKLLVDDLVHSGGALAQSEASRDILFRFTAPDAPGSYDLFVAANSVNRDGNSTGDMWALATTTITVAGGGGAGGDGGQGGGEADAGTDTSGGDDRGCSQTHDTQPPAPLLLAALAALGLRRRRHR